MGKTRYPSPLNYSGQNIVPCVCKQCGRRFPSKNKRRKHTCAREDYTRIVGQQFGAYLDSQEEGVSHDF